MLNLVNELSYLQTDEFESQDNNTRCLDLYISHDGKLVAVGYEDSSLIWFSYFELNDFLSLRRVFECMKQSVFYRKTTFENMLRHVNFELSDFEYMSYLHIDDISSDTPIIIGYTAPCLNGTDFAVMISDIPEQMRMSIRQMGSDDDILMYLEKDYRYLTSEYDDADAYRKKAFSICSKWQKCDFLKFSERASVRQLYHDICYYSLEKGA